MPLSCFRVGASVAVICGVGAGMAVICGVGASVAAICGVGDAAGRTVMLVSVKTLAQLSFSSWRHAHTFA